ncbi:hypothetical protein CC78DRAFT_481216 [Lojkania enalia]|uniref:Fatty acid hydroxylase domain-containing protein n=1 Tax=Lojkania enalia TaxID=147567 RepID=A0A9P4JWG1_9PLEO|nr:hypothetical protein CC78DRAFT_481216 [Didymosphaeria enalia]
MILEHNASIAPKIRAILVPVVLSAILLPQLYQPFLSALWHFLQTNAIFRLSVFETLWTVFLYAAIEVPMTIVFLRHPEWRFAVRESQKINAKGSSGENALARPRGMRRPSRRLREIAIYMAPLLLMDLTMIKKFADVPLEQMLESGNYHITFATTQTNDTSTSPYPKTFLVPTLHNITFSSPLQTQRALPKNPPTSRRIVLELALSFFIYDFLFFLFHFSLHILPGIKSWHAPHHRHSEIHPQVTNQLHIIERLGLVLLANFSLNIIGSHVFTRTLFVPIFLWLLVEIHSGLDLPWGYDKILPTGWGGGARKHALHHAGAGGCYEPYFAFWDGLLERWSRCAVSDT